MQGCFPLFGSISHMLPKSGLQITKKWRPKVSWPILQCLQVIKKNKTKSMLLTPRHSKLREFNNYYYFISRTFQDCVDPAYFYNVFTCLLLSSSYRKPQAQEHIAKHTRHLCQTMSRKWQEIMDFSSLLGVMENTRSLLDSISKHFHK